MSKAVTYGYRIKYIKHENQLISHRIYTDGMKMVRIIIDIDDMSFKFVDPVTGMIHSAYKKKWTNLEVLQRNVKKELTKYLGIKFDKEIHNMTGE